MVDMIKFIALVFVAILMGAAQAQSRLERPVQLQANFTGGLLSVTANANADPTVDDVKVNGWKPGIEIGYHLNRYIYLAYALHPSLDLTLREDWGFRPKPIWQRKPFTGRFRSL